MISQGGKKILEKFVITAKTLLMENVTALLQQHYGIWADGHYTTVEELPNQDTNIVHTAQMLRERLNYLLDALPEGVSNPECQAVQQLIAEQAFTQLNRVCAVRMCEERELIFESIRAGYDSVGFQSYDAIAEAIHAPKYNRYVWYLQSVFDELSMELPAVFDRFSPYGLIFPDERTLMKLLELINDEQLSNWYDEQNGITVNFWKEDETLGWIFQDYNSLEERRKMREESDKPRNAREMAVRNQFFTPEYVVRFLTDNSLGRIWYEMTQGTSLIGEEQCHYMIRRPSEKIPARPLKEPTEILSLDPTCGSMHFGLYLFEVYEYIYMDAWDHQPTLLQYYRSNYSRETFKREVPRLILKYNIFGCEIDPRALQIAALSLWLRAQKSYSEMEVAPSDRPLITKSNLVLAEAMPGNKRMLKGLMDSMDKPMQRLLTKVWEKMKFVGEAGLLFKMEKEIEEDIEYLRKNWTKINSARSLTLFLTEEEKSDIVKQNEKLRELRKNKGAFFSEIKERLQESLEELSIKLSQEEGYENALFSEDAARGFAFIELCQKRFDCIVMNPPFGEGSEHTSKYLDGNYPAWCKNLVCAFFDRMQEMLEENGRIGAIFDRTVMIKSIYEDFRKRNLCGNIVACADTGWGVLDANVETSSIVISKNQRSSKSIFIDLRTLILKNIELEKSIKGIGVDKNAANIYITDSIDFLTLPNSVIGYDFNKEVLSIFQNEPLKDVGFEAKGGHKFHVQLFIRLFYEISNDKIFQPVAGNGKFLMFYAPYRDVVEWKNEGNRVQAMNLIRNPDAQRRKGIFYGERGDVIDAQILKPNMFTTQGYIGIPIDTKYSCYLCLSFINSILAQFILNLYSGGHKMTTYVNLLPLPKLRQDHSILHSLIEQLIIMKRAWFSLDETNLEYHGLIEQIDLQTSIQYALNDLQTKISVDYKTYQTLVKQNDDLWMDAAEIDRNSEFRQTLNDYKSRRPYEELISIDGATNQNVIDSKVFAQEIIMELVGMAFGRWDTAYAKGLKSIPDWGDVFNPLPFMPVVSRDADSIQLGFEIPADGILSNDENSSMCLSERVRDVMHYLWNNKADDLEYELCQLIGYKSLHEYFAKPQGFFDYHFKRYTKSRRKAPIYWPLSTEDGKKTFWIYYPKQNKDTLPSLIMKLKVEVENLRSSVIAAVNSHDKQQENELRAQQQQVEMMQEELSRIVNAGYVPNHDDGVPVTAAPLYQLFSHTGFHNEAKANMEKLKSGEYDWSHLAMSLYPARVTEKAKKNWCMALTHGLEEICENKPKEKNARKKKTAAEPTLGI